MGKKLIIPGTNFLANGIALPMVIKITAGESVVIGGVTYSGGTNGESYELDTFPTTFKESSAVTYLESVTINSSDFQLKDAYFQYQEGLKRISFLSAPQTTNNLSTAFAYNRRLTVLDGLNLIQTTGVTNFSQMFRSCEQMTSLNVSNFDTSEATNISNMFAGCANITTLDLSSFDTKKVTNMDRVFSGCSKLQTLILGDDWDMVTGNPSMTDMFYLDTKLAAITAPNCMSTEYGQSGTQLNALISAITASGFNVARNSTPLVITCGDNHTVTGAYNHGTGWTWTVA